LTFKTFQQVTSLVTYSQDILDMFIKSEGIRKGNTKQLDWHNLFDSRYDRRQWGSDWRSVENYFLGFINIDNHCVISSPL